MYIGQSGYEHIIHRAHQNNLNDAAFRFDKGKAKLFLFTPRNIPTQVLRPHKYNFTNNFIDKLTHGKSYITNVFNSDEAPAILPDAVGMKLDTTALANMYSFILINDNAISSDGFNTIQQLGNFRQIMMGNVYNEPFNPATGAVNPNAILNFTYSTIIRVASYMGVQGHSSELIVSSNKDHINEIAGLQLPCETCVATPQNILSPEMGDDGTMFNASEIALSNNRTGINGNTSTPAFSVTTDIKSPVNHLSKICDALDSGITAAESSHNGIRSSFEDTVWDPHNHARIAAKNAAPGIYDSNPMQAIDPGLPITIANLDAKYFKGNLEVIPFNINPNSQWDIYPQDQITIKNTMSSFVSSTLSAICSACGIAHMVFRYSSWVKNMASGFNNPEGWQIIDSSTIGEVNDPNVQLNILNKFKRYCESHLFPTLQQMHGEFDLMAYVNGGGETLIDLNYLDLSKDMQNIGYYETNSRLGGMLNPLICDQATLAQNAVSINTLANHYINSNLGYPMGQAFR